MHFPQILNENGLRLDKTEKGIILTDGKMELMADFTEMLPRLRKGNLAREMLVKAAKVKKEKPVLMDATAGLGQDSLLLAAAGYEVFLFEKDPVIAALLGDALDRAEKNPLLMKTAARMHFTEGDSIAAMREQGRNPSAYIPSPDVILLDPMFPERQKSALVKKKFQLLHEIEKPCEDEVELLDAAVSLKPRKIVIKRPLKGPYLAGRKPDYSLSGKAVRYDCLVFAQKSE